MLCYDRFQFPQWDKTQTERRSFQMGVYTEIAYLADDPKYQTEKPYYIAFDVENIPGAQKTNHVFDHRKLWVSDGRREPPFRLEEAGFTFARCRTNLKYDDFLDPATVRTSYFNEIREWLLSTFPAYSDIILLDYVHRKRSAAFPALPGAKTTHAQPLTVPHTDYTSRSAAIKLEQIITTDGLSHLRGRSFDQLNLWRVIKGPNNDWPLAVCDYRSVDLAKDPLPNDVVLKDVPSEDLLLRASSAHQWWYISDQEVEDIIIFRNAASETDARSVGWHASFDTGIGGEHNRESLEMRLFAII